MGPPTRQLVLAAHDGTLTVHTGVAGRAARLGHRLTIGFGTWTGRVSLRGGEPVAVELRVDVASLAVTEGHGGVKGLSAPERAVATSNALSCLQPGAYPEIVFTSDDVAPTERGYRLTGDLAIHGVTRSRVVDVDTDTDTDTDTGDMTLAVTATVVQSEFGVDPYSLMMGSLKVTDEVAVEFHATVAATGPAAG